jgi:hypothetical protein
MAFKNCGTRIRGGCSPKSEKPDGDSKKMLSLEIALREIFQSQGIEPQDSTIVDFANQLAECESRAERWVTLLKVASRLPKTDILRWIHEAARRRDMDEALWRGFVGGHFGRTSTEDRETIGSSAKFLMAFGQQRYWTWGRISSNPDSLREWLFDHQKELRSLSYGNHRKYESQKPEILHRVFRTFLDWIAQNGGSPAVAFRLGIEEDPELKFRLLFRSVRSVFRFGRTGAFDLLCLLGGLGILAVRADSCYLRGSTGPMKGAKKLWGKSLSGELAMLADATARALRIPYDVFEDALCMWQK